MAEPALHWELAHHYHCAACGWIAPQSDFAVEPERCPCCGARPDGSDPWPTGTYRAQHGWTCFHCGETFHSEARARDHFGADPQAEPACIIKAELGLVVALREAEDQLARYRDEDSDKDRELARMAGDHATALRREEEQGYSRGLRDERARALRIIARIKAPIRNGGARNACDQIAADLRIGSDG
jgi:hypothetical protein